MKPIFITVAGVVTMPRDDGNPEFYTMTLQQLLAHRNSEIARAASRFARELNLIEIGGHPSSVPPRTMRDVAKPIHPQPSS